VSIHQVEHIGIVATQKRHLVIAVNMRSIDRNRNSLRKDGIVRSSMTASQPQQRQRNLQQVVLPDSASAADCTSLSATTTTTKAPSILWSAICRDDTLLVEADAKSGGGPPIDDDVHKASRLLLRKRPTPGWEHGTYGRSRSGTSKGNNGSGALLRGMKFHVYEHAGLRLNPGALTVWTFACLYDPSLVDTVQVRSFLEKITTMTEIFRQPAEIPLPDTGGGSNENLDWSSSTGQAGQGQIMASPQYEDLWRYGSDRALQDSFAPTLVQRMEEVAYLGKLAMCHERLDSLKDVMGRNIELLLERDERLERMSTEKAAQLNEMAKVFARRSRQVKRQMMWNNAMHGAALGAAVTAGVAVAVVPTLVVLL
jgi:Synaptobrevin